MVTINVSSTGRIHIQEDTTGIIDGDSMDYDILRNAATSVASLNGATIELGVRCGLASVLIMDSNPANKVHVCVDPYGNIDYFDDLYGKIVNAGYNNEMRSRVLYAMHKFAFDFSKNLLFFVMEDTEFFKRFSDGIPYYDQYKSIISQYSLVHFDGPHTIAAVLDELDFFMDRLELNGIFVFDDIALYDHDSVEVKLLATGKFEIFQKGQRKAAYRKIA